MAIAGQLPWGGGGAGALSDPAGSYVSAYNQALSMNKANYENILSGYNNTMAMQQSTQQGIIGGYGKLTGDVMGLIAGTDAAQRQAIADQYQANRGQASQSLIDRGLGNTTVQSSIDRGLQYDRSKAEVNLSNQFAQLNAQYRTQLGLAGLDYQNQANMQNTALANQQLQWMNSVNAGYPNAAAYMQLAQMKGANKAGAFGMPGPMGGGSVSWDKKPTPAPGAQAAGYYGSNAFGSFAGGGVAARGPASQTVYPGWQDWNGEDLSGYSLNGEPIDTGNWQDWTGEQDLTGYSFGNDYINAPDYSGGFAGWDQSTPGYSNTLAGDGYSGGSWDYY